MPKNNVSHKDNILYEAIESHFQGKINKARVKFICKFMIALCKVRNVCFEQIANGFDAQAKSSSSLRRIQRFIAGFTIDIDLISKLIFHLLPKKEELRLTIDRTNWKFGVSNINILMLGVVYKGIAFPLLFKMLDKRGNSNTKERVDLIDRFIKLFGVQCIASLTADREFVGKKWLEYLNNLEIKYYLRIRNNFNVFLPRKNKYVKASHLFNRLPLNGFKHIRKIVRIQENLCYLAGKKIKGKDGKIDFLIIASFNEPEKSIAYYQERWQIETCFKAMKSSGFDIEKTHLTDQNRIEKLVLLVMIAFVWCYKVGIHLHKNVKPIEVKKHGRLAKSIFKYGLDFLNNLFLNTLTYSKTIRKVNVFQFLSCT